MAAEAQAQHASQIALDEHEVERRLAVVGLRPGDIERIRMVRPIVERGVDGYVDVFFEHLRSLDETPTLFARPDILQDARTRKREHLLASVSGEYRVPYVEQRIALGQLYSQVRLEPSNFLGAFHQLMRAIGTDVMAAFPGEANEAFQRFMSLKKVGFFDIGIIVDVLIAERERTIAIQREAIRELSTPVLQLRDDLLILPLIGAIDSTRARQATDDLLKVIRARRAKAVVIDITGVPVVDSKVAQHLAQTMASCRLMGVEAIITGISGAVAQSLVTIGIDVSGFKALGDLQRGVEAAERLLGTR